MILKFTFVIQTPLMNPKLIKIGSILISSLITRTGVNATLRGRAQVQWKLIKNAAIYTVRNCKILVDQKKTVWGLTGIVTSHK